MKGKWGPWLCWRSDILKRFTNAFWKSPLHYVYTIPLNDGPRKPTLEQLCTSIVGLLPAYGKPHPNMSCVASLENCTLPTPKAEAVRAVLVLVLPWILSPSVTKQGGPLRGNSGKMRKVSCGQTKGQLGRAFCSHQLQAGVGLILHVKEDQRNFPGPSVQLL